MPPAVVARREGDEEEEPAIHRPGMTARMAIITHLKKKIENVGCFMLLWKGATQDQAMVLCLGFVDLPVVHVNNKKSKQNKKGEKRKVGTQTAEGTSVKAQSKVERDYLLPSTITNRNNRELVLKQDKTMNHKLIKTNHKHKQPTAAVLFCGWGGGETNNCEGAAATYNP